MPSAWRWCFPWTPRSPDFHTLSCSLKAKEARGRAPDLARRGPSHPHAKIRPIPMLINELAANVKWFCTGCSGRASRGGKLFLRGAKVLQTRVKRHDRKVTRHNRDCSHARCAVNLSRMASPSPFKVKDTTTGRFGDRTLRKLRLVRRRFAMNRSNGVTRAGPGQRSGGRPRTVNVVADALRRA